jgi:nitrite reductase/ring-hydroxylating ferredoxin subunit
MTGAGVNGKNALAAVVDDQYYTIGDAYTHMGCELSDGMLNGENVTCPCHGSVFNVRAEAL